MNDGRATRRYLALGSCSYIDLTVVSEFLTGVCTWDVWGGSHHYVICCKIGIDVSESLEEKIGRWTFKSAN